MIRWHRDDNLPAAGATRHTECCVIVSEAEERRCKTKSKSMAKELPGVRALCSSSVAVQQPTGYFSSHAFPKY